MMNADESLSSREAGSSGLEPPGRPEFVAGTAPDVMKSSLAELQNPTQTSKLLKRFLQKMKKTY